MSRFRAWMSSASRLLPLLALGCSEAEVVAELPSLQGSEDAVFLCRDANGVGRPFAECPDRDGRDDESKDKALSIFALVSQTVTDQVAVVNVTRGKVVDVDPSTPGFGFLRVGGRPVSMAATPGGHASFVATAELGRNGIFALPTSCIEAPKADEGVRDLTSWPACRLDGAPGEIAVVVQTGDTAGCSTAPDDGTDGAGGQSGADTAQSCSATLLDEAGPEGERKLLVSLPDTGELGVIDAQWLLDRAPGEFPPCHFEKRIALDVNVPADAVQTLPPDLAGACADPPVSAPPPPSRQTPRPAGFALADGRLYVADQAAPVIHVLDTSNLCSLTELEPLLPMSLREPERVVTTRRVAASPVTPSGKQFVYAIDAEDQPGASVMAFDVSAYPANRTPVVRPGSPELPGEKPDRLGLASSAKDVTFAYRDLPYADPTTGVATFGLQCDPNPETPKDSPAGLARPTSDFTSGARPGLLRGLFGFVLLSNGSIAVVDVEDFDAPCRRPVATNHSSTPDFRGCASDPEGVASFTEENDGETPRTVTGEVSCQVVQPHRFRSATLAISDPEVGVRAPSLRGFPQLKLPAEGANTPIEERPRMLGVPFDSGGTRVNAEVFVGSTPYSTDQAAEDVLPIDPNSIESEQLQTSNSVVLPPLQPRAYATEDSVTLTYEGAYVSDRTAGFLRTTEDGSLVLRDNSLSFCSSGVYDRAAMTDYATTQLGLSGAEATSFGVEHSDILQLTTALPDKSDSYWTDERSYQDCLEWFGSHDAENLSENRDFRVVAAFTDHLELEALREEQHQRAAECFPSANKYRLRAGRHWVLLHASSGFNHDVVAAGDTGACVRSCNPLKKWARARVFEISSDHAGCASPDPEADPLSLRVGCKREGETACVYDQTAHPAEDTDEVGSGVQLGKRGSECIFDGLTERFALYRGRAPSERDSVFSWQTTGGFSPLVMSLSNVSESTSPQSMQFLSEPELMAVVDGSGLGLTLFSLDTFVVTKPSPFY